MGTHSLPASEARIISRIGTWDVAFPSSDDADNWILERLRAMGDVPLGPYFLVLDYDDAGKMCLMHGVSYQRQMAKGANMEHLGTAYIGNQAQVDWIRKTPQTNREP